MKKVIKKMMAIIIIFVLTSSYIFPIKAYAKKDIKKYIAMRRQYSIWIWTE